MGVIGPSRRDGAQVQGDEAMLNRRAFVAGSVISAPFLPSVVQRATAQAPIGSNPFAFSVASGDPTADAVVIWTRLARAANDPEMISKAPVAVEWSVASDRSFGTVVRRGTAMASPDFGFSVHVDVQGLEADREYWYMFRVGAQESPVGRMRTLPLETGPASSFRFNIVSCQHWENGYFDAYDGMKDDGAAFVLHLGDYIYGVGRGGVRQHDIPRPPKTLAEYRSRHALYRTDAALRRAHETMPFICVLDNHDALEFNTDDPAELVRRAAAYQAWYEFMPTRLAASPMNPAMAIAREVRVGSLLQLLIPDTRQFRASHEVCREVSDPKFAFGVYKKACDMVSATERSMLGRAQEVWLEGRLKASAAKWNAIGTTVPMTPFDMDHNGDLYRYMGSWDGFPANRARILDLIEGHKVSNPVSISGDIHSTLVSTVVRRAGDAPDKGVLTEFVGTSMSSAWPEPLAKPMRDAMPKNPHLGYFNHAKRGYTRFTVTDKTWTADMRTIDATDKPGGRTTTDASFVVENGKVGWHRA